MQNKRNRSVRIFLYFVHSYSHCPFYLVSAIDQNYIFTSLTSEDRAELVASMESLEIEAGENVVTQGTQLLFIIVDDKFLMLL